MRCKELYERRQRRTLTMAEAAEMFGITERTFLRWSGRYDAEGSRGCRIDGPAEPRPAWFQSPTQMSTWLSQLAEVGVK
jgi:transposase